MMESNPVSKKKLHFNQGSNYFRQRLVLSLLSARPIKIEEIRSHSDFNVGVAPYEVSFIHLLDKVSNGSRFTVSETGTEVSLIPGSLLGGPLEHSCDTSRPLSYYLEPLLLLAPFCKKPLNLTLKGRLQNDKTGYNSIYKIKHAALPLMEIFGLEPDIQIKFKTYEESEIIFTCTVKKQLLTLRNQLNNDCGKVKKIRGLAYGFRVSPQMLNRIVTSAKGEFLPFISDVHITNESSRNTKSKLPGFGLVLYAITTKELHYCTDGFIGQDTSDKGNEDSLLIVTSQNINEDQSSRKRKFRLFGENEEDPDSEKTAKKKSTLSENLNFSSFQGNKALGSLTSPEELGVHVSKLLLREIASKSCVDSVFQWLILGFMALGPKDVTSVVVGPLTPFTVQFLRDLKIFFGVTFKIDVHHQETDEDEFVNAKKSNLNKLSCVGTGYINLNKTML